MKTGTDNVLFGSWMDLKDANRILDIGAGSGLLSLMATQRNSQALVTALEISSSSCIDARENFQNSPWPDRFSLVNLPLSEFKPSEKFDLIISNPPFFNETVSSPIIERDLARRENELSPDTLFQAAKDFTHNGRISILTAANRESDWLMAADLKGLFLNRICHVYGAPNKAPVRILAEFSASQTPIEKLSITVRGEDRKYTSQYLDQVRDFYDWA